MSRHESILARAFAVALLATCIFVTGRAAAQTYPSRPITLVVPFPPGGATDAIARIIQDSMSQSLGQQLVMMLTLMLTSKGVAGVPRAALVVLAATLATFNLPLEGAAILLAIDQIMDMGRTAVNVMGNCIATAVVARWEGVFDDERMRAFAAGRSESRAA